jgi:hypothetical protein
VLDQQAADDRARRDRQRGRRAPDSDRTRELLGRKRGTQDRQRIGHQHRARYALDDPEAHEFSDRRGQRAAEGSQREAGDPDRKDPPPPEPVAELAAGDQQHRERE